MKRVAWPPVNPNASFEATDYDNGNGIGVGPEMTREYRHDSNRFPGQQQGSSGSKVAPPVPPKPGTRELAHAQVRIVNMDMR